MTMFDYQKLKVLLNVISDVLPFSQDDFTETEKAIQQAVIRIREQVELPPHLHVQYLCEYCQETTNDPDMHRYCELDEV